MANEAENALEALVGPFRLRKIVRTALRDGMLMPFALSVNRGEATARLEKIQGISEVRRLGGEGGGGELRNI